MSSPTSLIEVRLLGAFSVRRADGHAVATKAWRTTKTRDLVRMLALHAGTGVSVDRILEALWPDVEAGKARASLRTATCQVRKVLGEASLEREFDTLVLRGAWVDLHAYLDLVAEADIRWAEGDQLQGLRVAAEAIALYSGGVGEDDPYAEWLSSTRGRIALVHQDLLARASESALELGWWRRAIDLARATVAHDRCDERGYRTMMVSHARLGQTAAALRAFEACRAALSDELGADPAAETDALHSLLLAGRLSDDVAVPLVGRRATITGVAALVTGAIDTQQAASVWITGLPGSGLTRVADEVVAVIGHGGVRAVVRCEDQRTNDPMAPVRDLVVALGGRPEPVDSPLQLAELLAAVPPGLVVVHDLHRADPAAVAILREACAHAASRAVLLVTCADVGHHVMRPPNTHEVRVGPLSDEDLAELVAAIVKGQPTPALVEHVRVRSEGRVARAVATTRMLLVNGVVEIVPGGVDLAREHSSDGAHRRTVQHLLDRARGAVDVAGADLIDLLAVAGGPVAIDTVFTALADHPREMLLASAHQLEDLAVVTCSSTHVAYRHERYARVASAWLRPSRRSDLQGRLAAHIADAAQMHAADRLLAGLAAS